MLQLWERVGSTGVVLVIIGCFLEGIEYFPSSLTSRLRINVQLMHKIGWLLLVVGLGLEFFGGTLAEEIKDEETGRLKQEASDANQRSQITELTNSLLQSSVATLQSQVTTTSSRLEQAQSNALALLNQLNELQSVTKKIDPTALPVVTAEAQVWLKFKDLNPVTNDIIIESVIEMGFLTPNTNTYSLVLECTKYAPITIYSIEGPRHNIDLSFKMNILEDAMDSGVVSSSNLPLTPKKFAECREALISIPGLIANKEVSGLCTVTLNNSIRKTYVPKGYSQAGLIRLVQGDFPK